MSEAVDWALAQRTGVRLAPSGPRLDPGHTRAAVAELRELAAAAVAPVAERTGMLAPAGSAVTEVVDRPTWIRSNVEGFRVALAPLLARLDASQGDGLPLRAVRGVGSRATGVQMGAVLAWLSGKVLGQFEIFSPRPTPRLLLVAPNIVTVERALDVPARDFRLWVCLHEETHRVQFGAVPWLAAHLTARLQAFLEAADEGAGAAMRRITAAAGDSLRRRDGSGLSLLELVQTPAQREVLGELTALMSLLEGHADHVMDDVGPQVVPSVATIRERFEHRRHGASGLDGLARRLLGVDAKLAQYADGAAFVRGVEQRVGREGFARVWESPATLPRAGEIADPAAWVARVIDG